MSEEQRMILHGRSTNGHEFEIEQKADKDEQGFWLDVIFTCPSVPGESLEVRIRPESVEEFAESNPNLFKLVLSVGINVLVTGGALMNPKEEKEFISLFIEAFRKAAELRGSFFYGPVGTVQLPSPEPPVKKSLFGFLKRR